MTAVLVKLPGLERWPDAGRLKSDCTDFHVPKISRMQDIRTRRRELLERPGWAFWSDRIRAPLLYNGPSCGRLISSGLLEASILRMIRNRCESLIVIGCPPSTGLILSIDLAQARIRICVAAFLVIQCLSKATSGDRIATKICIRQSCEFRYFVPKDMLLR